MTRPPVGLLVVVALLAAGTGAVSAVHQPASRTSGPKLVEILGATAVCPDVRQLPGVYQTRVSVGAAPLPPGRVATGGSVVTSLVVGGPKQTTLPLSQPGQVASGLATTVRSDAVEVAATGALATGLEVEQVFRASGGPFRGLANLRCEPPRRDAWFVGASTGVDDASLLVLANVDDTPATVDISAFGQSGAVDQRPGQGISVPAHGRTVFQLDQLAPDQRWLVVRVASRQGRVVAALRNSKSLDSAPRGFDYVPEAVAPATSVVVPGIPEGPGFRGLVIGNPTGDDTTVSVSVTVKDGQFVPQGLSEVDVPAHHTRLVTLNSLTNDSPVTATVTSTGAPVVAGTVLYDVQQFQASAVQDMAFGASSVPLSGSALLTDLVINRPTESTLVLSAPQDAATVVVTPIRVLGIRGPLPLPRTVHIPAGRTLIFRLSTFFPPGASARLAVEVRPQDDSGPVYATRYLREHGARGTLSTLLTLEGPAQQVVQPATVQDDQAAYP